MSSCGGEQEEARDEIVKEHIEVRSSTAEQQALGDHCYSNTWPIKGDKQ